MDIKGNIKGIVFKFCIIFLSLCTLLWFSIFSYGILYYLYIPAIAHIKPVYLQYDMSCYRGRLCKHPFDNITLIEEGQHEFMRGGQGYAIELVLEMAESERNLKQGMFMIKLDMLQYNGSVVKSSYRPALLHYRSPIFKTIYTLFFIPGLLAGSVEEKQSLMIPLFEKYVEDSHHPAHFAFIEVQAQTAEVYSSSLRIHAQFTGLRYLMYYWPVLSAVVGVGCNFLFLLVTIILIWLRETMKKPSATNIQQESWQSPSTKKEFKKPPKKRHFQKFLGGTKDKTEKKADIPNKIRKGKVEIENLLSSRVHYGVTHNAGIITRKEDEVGSDDEFFDVDASTIPPTNSSVTPNPGDLSPEL